MPQLILPLIPIGTTRICDLVSVHRSEKFWTYFLGLHPIYSHAPDDARLFRLTIAMLIESGACRNCDIVKTFGVSRSLVDRSLKKYRKGGAAAFFQRKPGGRKGTVLTPKVLDQVQLLLDHGFSRKDAAQEVGVSPDTLRKAINDGRLRESKAVEPTIAMVSDKSSRSALDAAATDGMGTACTRVLDRTLASIGEGGEVDVRFEPCLDVPKAGVLCALPALLANGLLEDVQQLLGKIKGYYSIFQILLLVAFMSLYRIKAVDRLQGLAPGELGKLLGLDRSPGVRCLREKMDALSAGNAADIWAAHLSKHWMEADPEAAGTLYIDGHVQTYHGSLTKLPRRYVARQRLCLRGTTEYWINDAVGRPFFMIDKPVDPGFVQTLEKDIVPRLLTDVPDQPKDATLAEKSYVSRFILVFDREGYSPAFFGKMWRDHRIACITYRKYPDDDWPTEWFSEKTTRMPGGETVTIHLSEMGSLIGSGKDAIWMREIRKLTDSGHQTSLISTAYDLPLVQVAVRMFTRWCQENFFKYMRQHFGIDMLCEYGVIEFPDAEKVVNPSWRELNRSRSRLQNKIKYRHARFAEMTMHPESETDPEKFGKWLRKKSDLLEEIEQFEHELETVKDKIKEVKKHILWGELEDKDKFTLTLHKIHSLTLPFVAHRENVEVLSELLHSRSW